MTIAEWTRELELISEQIESSMSELDEYYAILRQHVPLAEKRVTLACQELRTVFDYFLAEGNGRSFFRTIADNAQSCLEYILNWMENAKSCRPSAERIENLRRIVFSVKPFLDDLDLLSLNMRLFAAKRTYSAQGLDMFTRHVHRIVAGLKRQFAELSETVGHLTEESGRCAGKIGELPESETAVRRDVFQAVVADLERWIKFVESTRWVCMNLSDHFTQIMKSIEEIVIFFQWHDLLRQSEENMKKCCVVLRAHLTDDADSAEETVERLECVAFAEAGMRLLSRLAAQVEEEMRTSLSEIVSVFERLSSAVSEFADDAGHLADFFAAPGATMECLLGEIVRNMEHAAERCRCDMEASDKWVEDERRLRDRFGELASRMNVARFDTEILRSMPILAKLEFVHASHETRMMDGLLENAISRFVDAFVEQDALFRRIRKETEYEFEQFRKFWISNRRPLEIALLTLKKSVEGLKLAGAVVGDTVGMLFREIRALADEVAALRHRLLVVEPMLERLHALHVRIERMADEIREEKERLIRRQGSEAVGLKEEELLRLFGQLTGYAERKTAKETLGVDGWDEGSERGDLILF